MITPAERAYIYERAYVPEHLPHYVSAISQTEPFLLGEFVVHVAGAHLIFVGYPLRESPKEQQILEKLDEARERFKPESLAVIAPELPAALECGPAFSYDAYYRIDLAESHMPKKARNMITRASREVSIQAGRFGKEHKKLVDDFLHTQSFDNATKFIFRRVDAYVKCETTFIFEARNRRGDLVAFDVAEFGAREYAFYMFNFRSRKYTVPGVSDLLLSHILERARWGDKRYVNLGLGINPGVTFFKKKWGASPFVRYASGEQELKKKVSWETLFDQLSGL